METEFHKSVFRSVVRGLGYYMTSVAVMSFLFYAAGLLTGIETVSISEAYLLTILQIAFLLPVYITIIVAVHSSQYDAH